MRCAFTLIELLIVVTIIVVLLALLTPALDKAMTEALMATDASRLDAIAVGATTYVGAHRGWYPYRRVMDKSLNPPPYNCWTNILVDRTDTVVTGISTGVNPGTLHDDRPTFTPYFGLNTFRDPLTGGQFNLSATDGAVFSDYMLFFGMRFLYAAGGGKGMYKIGDRLEWTEPPSRGGRKHSLNILASDQDVIVSEADPYQKVWSSHPDSEGKMTLVVGNSSQSSYFAKWLRPADRKRGLIDTHYAFTDGSVERFEDVTYDESERADGRMGHVPVPAAGDGLYVASRVPKNR